MPLYSSNDILSFYSLMVATLKCIMVAMYNVLVIVLYIRYFCYAILCPFSILFYICSLTT